MRTPLVRTVAVLANFIRCALVVIVMVEVTGVAAAVPVESAPLRIVDRLFDHENPATLGLEAIPRRFPSDVWVAMSGTPAKYKGRIVIPYYFGMYPDHPDYSTTQRGGYAIWKGEKIILETHTHIPEMSGSFVCYSDDEGETWQCCVNDQGRGFMMGYFKDGHMGHMTCEEPTIVLLNNGSLLCVLRASLGTLYQGDSSFRSATSLTAGSSVSERRHDRTT